MRHTIVLLATPATRRELEARLRRAGSYEAGDVFDYLEMGGCRFGVDLSGRVLDEYDEDEMTEIAEHLDEVEAVLLEYPGVACARSLLEVVLDGLDGVLDTNFGELVKYNDVLARFRQDPSWDWTYFSV